MPAAIVKTDAYTGKTDLFKVDPRLLKVEDGFNPRSFMDQDLLEELKASIRTNGFYPDCPLLLKRRGPDLYVISGHRRLKAVLELIDEGEPIESVPALTDDTGDPAALLARALAANTGAVPLDPLDEAHAYKRLVGYGWEVKNIALRVGCSPSHVYQRLKLLEAEPEVLSALHDGSLTTTEAIRAVQEANRTGVRQTEVVAQKVREKAAAKASTNGAVKGQGSEAKAAEKLTSMLYDYGVVWAVRVLLDFADKDEVLDAVHDVCEEVAQ